MKERAMKAEKATEKMKKSKPLWHSIIYEGTLSTLFARSGAGKTKIIVIAMMEIAQAYPHKTIYYFAPDLSIDDILEIREQIKQHKLNNFALDQDSTGDEFMVMMETYGRTDGTKDIIFVVDTFKKIAAVNNKDGLSKTFAILKRVVSRGATGFLIAHTNKDNETMSGTAENEQDVDNVLTIDYRYDGEDIITATIKAAPDKRCRSRIKPLTLEMSRDGFDFKLVDEPVDKEATAKAEREEKQKGNIIEIAQDIVLTYYAQSLPLGKTKLQNAIKENSNYTGNKKNEVLSKMIDKISDEGYIEALSQTGRSYSYIPATDNKEEESIF